MDPFRGWMDGWVDRFSCGPSLCTPFGVIRHVISLPEILAPLTTTATLAREAESGFCHAQVKHEVFNLYN